jgi:flagellar hook-associated protein 3 FlgL
MTSIPPYSYNARVALNATASFKNQKEVLDTLQTQLATGRTAETYAGLGSGTSASLRLNARIETLDGYGEAITDAQLRIDIASTGLTDISRVARDLGTTLAGTKPSSPISRNLGPITAMGDLAQTVDVLNSDINGRYLFSGRAADTQPVLSLDVLLNGDGNHDGLKQVVANRQLNDGVAGMGRLASASAGTSVTLSGDATSFGFKVAAATASGTRVTAVKNPGPPATVAINVASQPNEGESVSIDLSLPDGTTQTLTLAATASATGEAGTYAIGATPAATAANIKAALDTAVTTAASTSLSAASALRASTDFFDGSYSSTTTVAWYQGDTGSVSARETAPVQVGDTLTVAIGLRADEPGLRKVLAAFGALAVSSFPESDATSGARYDALAGKLSAALGGTAGASAVDTMTVDLGNASATLKLASERVLATKAQVQTMAGDIDDVSPEKVAAELISAQTRLQASYQTTSTIARMSLVDYLG